ncbi:MAG: putative transcriptional regulator [Rhodospirillales bacterium]|nr:putative transcriptional regulator [Rhodospirillales bacterium]
MSNSKTEKKTRLTTDEIVKTWPELSVAAADAADPLKTVSGAPSNNEERTLEQAIGIQIRLFRKHYGLTVAELSGAAGISTGMLSKIENGQISPSLTTLQILAKALNLPMTSLFASFEEKRDCSYVVGGQGVLIERRGTKVGHQYRLLGHSLAGEVVVEPYLITLTEDAAPYTAFQHDGNEFIYMLTGEVIYAHADQTYHLRPGDALLFDSGAPHGPKTLITVPMTYLSIITYVRT